MAGNRGVEAPHVAGIHQPTTRTTSLTTCAERRTRVPANASPSAPVSAPCRPTRPAGPPRAKPARSRSAAACMLALTVRTPPGSCWPRSSPVWADRWRRPAIGDVSRVTYGPWAIGTSFGTLRTSTARRRSHLVAEPVRRSGLFAGASRDGETRTRTGPDGVPGRGHGRLHRGRVARPGLEPGTRRFSGTGTSRRKMLVCSRFADRERVLDAGGFLRFPVGLGHGRGVRGLNRHPPMSVAGWAGLPRRARSPCG